MRHVLLLAAVSSLAASCFPSAEAMQQDRFRKALLQAPEMDNPAVTGKVDPVVTGNWDSSFRMESYTPTEICFVVEWNVPPSLAPSLPFKLAGWRTAEETAGTAKTVTSTRVEVLDSATLAKVKHYDVSVNARGDRMTAVERSDKEQAMYQTGMRVCFADAKELLAPARYLVITVEAERHQTGAGWRLRSGTTAKPNPG